MGKRPQLELTETQRIILAKVSRSYKESKRRVVRAKTLLRVAQGIRTSAIAKELGVSVAFVQKWSWRWFDGQETLNTAENALCRAEESRQANREYRKKVLGVLDDAYRCGVAPTFSAQDVVAIVALACEKLDDSAEPVSYRSQKEIAREAVRRGIVKNISVTTVWRFLKSG